MLCRRVCFSIQLKNIYDTEVQLFLPPANEVCEGYVFTGVCLSMGVPVQGEGGLVQGKSLSRWISLRGVSVGGGGRGLCYGNVRAVRILLECIFV